MDRDATSGHSLLPPHSHDEDTEIALGKNPRCRCRSDSLLALLCISSLSIALNIFLVYTDLKIFPAESYSGFACKSAYTGLSLDTPTIHYHHTDYWSANQTLADESWESIDTNPMVVALTDEYADSHSLPRSGRFPWDVSKGRYFVKVFHQLHCLVST
jgi:hypothetical protein